MNPKPSRETVTDTTCRLSWASTLVLTAVIAAAGFAHADGGSLTATTVFSTPHPDSLPGVAIECTDVRTGSPFAFRAQRVLLGGAVDHAWQPDSTRRCLGSFDGLRQRMVPDGEGGAYVGWVDSRAGDADIYLQRFAASGEVAQGWPGDGLAICAAPLSQYHLDLASDLHLRRRRKARLAGGR